MTKTVTPVGFPDMPVWRCFRGVGDSGCDLPLGKPLPAGLVRCFLVYATVRALWGVPNGSVHQFSGFTINVSRGRLRQWQCLPEVRRAASGLALSVRVMQLPGWNSAARPVGQHMWLVYVVRLAGC